MKLQNDKYYTPSDLARKLTVKALKLIHPKNITEIVEPSAGNGSFSKHIKNCIAYDIEPEAEGIIKQDYLKLKLPYKKGRLVIGNPPFGSGNTLSVKFFKKSCEIADYIAFIQPISQLNNNLQMYLFDLVYSEDLGVIKYSDRELHCCFNIYKRPEHGLNPKPSFVLKDITIREYRRGGKYVIPEGYDYAICNWGNGSLGKRVEYVGQFAQEAYFYCHKKEFLQPMLDLLEFSTIREFVKSISMKRISVMRLYKYLKDNIEGIE